MSDEVRKIFPFPFPSKGLVTASPTLILDNSFSPSMNGMHVYGGEVRNTPGTANFGQTAGGSGVVTLDNIPLELAIHHMSDRTRTPVVATRTKIYRWSGGGPTDDWLDLTGSATFTGTDTDPWSFASVLDTLYFTNGIDGLWKWPGTGTITQVLTPDQGSARFLEVFAGRLVGAHTYRAGSTYADEVRWSGYLTPESWDPATDPTAGSNTTNLEAPGPITGLRAHGGTQLLLYKRSSIFSMVETGLVTPAFAFRLAVPGIGCIAGRTIVNIQGRHFFLGEDNVYAYDGASLPTPIGTPIRDSLFGANQVSTILNQSYLRQTFAFHSPNYNEYVLCFPGVGQSWPGFAYSYNYLEGTWSSSIIPGWTCASNTRTVNYNDPWNSDASSWNSDATIWDVPSVLDESVFVILGVNDKKTYRFSESVITSSSYSLRNFSTSDTDFGLPHYNKSIDRIYVVGRPESASHVRISVSTDGGATWVSSASTPWTVSTGLSTLAIPIPRTTGRYFRVRYECGGTSRILGIAALVLPRSEIRP